MKRFNSLEKFESNTDYLFNGETLSIGLSDATHLEEKIYRAIYMSEKTYLDTAIYLKDLSNVTLDFAGATLFLRDDTIQPFLLDGCKNVTIKNVIIEYERSLLNEMDIVDIKEGEIWCRQTEKQKKYFPMKVEDGCLVPIAGKKEYPDAFKDPIFFNLYDKDTKNCLGMYLVRVGTNLTHIPKEKFPFQYHVFTVEQRDENIILHGNVPCSMVSGVTCAMTHSRRDLSSCFIIRSKNVTLENFRILNGAGMGILGMYSENITLDKVKYFSDKRSQGIATNAADAVHFISCFGKVEIINSIFEGMKDDALNIHGNYYTISSFSDNVIHAKINTDIQASPGVNAHYKMFDKGDKLAIYRGSTTVVKQNLTVKKVDITGDFTADIYFDGDIADISVGDTIENLSIQADLHIKNCRFGKAHTNLRLQTRGKILIEDSECSLAIALTGDKNYWYEGSPITDLTIRNCQFKERGFILANPSFDRCEESPYYHSGIKIVGNTFDVNTALNLSHCKDILFSENKNTFGLPFENKFNNCKDIVEK